VELDRVVADPRGIGNRELFECLRVCPQVPGVGLDRVGEQALLDHQIVEKGVDGPIDGML
jgi:hypothetical protein